MMKSVLVICKFCAQEFNAPLKEIHRGNGKFCSHSCSARSIVRVLPLNCECRYCGKKFHKPPNKLKHSKSGLYFCCREHKDLAQKFSSNIPEITAKQYKTGKYIEYRKLVSIESCNRCGYSDVPKILVVHHKDRNRSNNDKMNLEVLCPNCHDLEHYSKKDGRFKK